MFLPSGANAFFSHLRRYILDLEKGDEDMNWEFVAKELIGMTGIFDLGDEVGRQNLSKLVKDLLSSNKTPASFIPHLSDIFMQVEKNTQSRIEQVEFSIDVLLCRISSPLFRSRWPR